VVLIALINAVMGLILLWEARTLSLRCGASAAPCLVRSPWSRSALIVVPNNMVADPNINVMGRSHGTILQVAEDNVAAVQACR